MTDLKHQIRAYYEATTEPVDVEAIAVEPGAVLVGPFPDAAQRRTEMQTVTPEKPPMRRVWRGLAAAAAAAVVGVIAGVILLLVNGDRDVDPATPTPTTQAAPDEEPAPTQEITVDEALQVTDAYWAAHDAGDFAAVTELFTADATTDHHFSSRSEIVAWIEQFRAWRIAQGTTESPRECNAASLGEGTVGVTCRFEDLPVLHEAVGAPPVRIQVTLEVGADGIQEWRFFPGQPNYDAVSQPFLLWMEEHHPDVAPTVDRTTPITNSSSVEEAELLGRIRSEYAQEWADYLEANGCTYHDRGC